MFPVAETHVSSTVLLGMVVAVVGWLLFRTQRCYRRVRRAAGDWLPAAPGRGQEGQPAEADSPELVRWEVAMHDTVRALSGQLDSKMAALEQLILEADRAAARLEAVLRAAGHAPEADGPPDEPPRGGGPPHTRFAGSQADALKRAPAPAARDPGGTTGQHGHPKPPREEVYTLADYGYPPQEIARRLGTPVGEVELILGLRQTG